MSSLHSLLYVINQQERTLSQRDLALRSSLSLGKVNNLLKHMEQNGYVRASKEEKGFRYDVTDKGLAVLDDHLRSERNKRVQLEKRQEKIKQAVILAAGKPKDIQEPIPLLSIGEECILDRCVRQLTQQGIEKIILVAGYEKGQVMKFASKFPNMEIVYNDEYETTGTMASLFAAKDLISDDFFLVEGDLVFETRGLEQLQECKDATAFLITSIRDVCDEAMVEVRDGAIYKMGKDIRQFNRIDGEMIGLSKVNYAYFQKILRRYEENDNALVNYEYLMLDISREYRLGYVKPDDFIWAEVDQASQLERLCQWVLPVLIQRESKREMAKVRELLSDELQIPMDDLISIEPSGGMTNNSYKANFKDDSYIVRMAGNGTDRLINRHQEKENSAFGRLLGLDVETLYFNEVTGSKVSKFIKDAETINAITATYPQNMIAAVRLMKKLHQSELEFDNEFNVFEEINHYESYIDECHGQYYPGYFELRAYVSVLESRLEQIGRKLVPCHIDNVPENFIKNPEDRMYMIDWEYSGMNEVEWDLACFALECNFTRLQEEKMIRYYYKNQALPAHFSEKILIYKILMDILWSNWTIFKECTGDDFGSYGFDRFTRAQRNIEVYKKYYGGENK